MNEAESGECYDSDCEESKQEAKEQEKNAEHFASTYSLKPNESYEANHYSYESDRYGRIKRCEGALRLEDGKRNTDHQRRAGGSDRLETDQGGHLFARRFGGSEKIDNLVPMDKDLNNHEYGALEDEWADELGKGNEDEVSIRCRYEGESTRPSQFVVKYKVTEPDGSCRVEQKVLNNRKGGER